MMLPPVEFRCDNGNPLRRVETIFGGMHGRYSCRFMQMCSPLPGRLGDLCWEKGQVENQVGVVRDRLRWTS